MRPAKAPSAEQLSRSPWRFGLVRFSVTGALAAIALSMAGILSVPAWAVFLGWTASGLVGTPAKSRIILGGDFAFGAIGGWTTVMAANALTFLPSSWALPLALGLACGLIAALELTRITHAVAACFFGMIAFFASGAPLEIADVAMVVAAGLLGVAFAWIATTLTGAGDRWLHSPSATAHLNKLHKWEN